MFGICERSGGIHPDRLIAAGYKQEGVVLSGPILADRGGSRKSKEDENDCK